MKALRVVCHLTEILTLLGCPGVCCLGVVTVTALHIALYLVKNLAICTLELLGPLSFLCARKLISLSAHFGFQSGKLNGHILFSRGNKRARLLGIPSWWALRMPYFLQCHWVDRTFCHRVHVTMISVELGSVETPVSFGTFAFLDGFLFFVFHFSPSLASLPPSSLCASISSVCVMWWLLGSSWVTEPTMLAWWLLSSPCSFPSTSVHAVTISHASL